jgi:hypothetical protein
MTLVILPLLLPLLVFVVHYGLDVKKPLHAMVSALHVRDYEALTLVLIRVSILRRL